MDQRERLTFFFFGDSITAGYPHGAKYSWVSLAHPYSKDFTFRNFAEPGATLEQIQVKIEHALIKEGLPNAIFVMGGTNDIAEGSSTPRVLYRLQAIWDLLKNKGIPRIWGIPIPSLLEDLEKKLKEYRLQLEELLKQNQEEYIPFYKVFFEEGKIATHLYQDSNHPTPLGQKMMADFAGEYLKRFAKKILKKNP